MNFVQHCSFFQKKHRIEQKRNRYLVILKFYSANIKMPLTQSMAFFWIKLRHEAYSDKLIGTMRQTIAKILTRLTDDSVGAQPFRSVHCERLHPQDV